jgi:hypothetical protein
VVNRDVAKNQEIDIPSVQPEANEVVVLVWTKMLRRGDLPAMYLETESMIPRTILR